jgi:energy-coupling factor transporter ATP-binding protein EcfA2
MKYIFLELKGYKRLSLNNINLIRIEPKELLQLIIGSNGSGKSSLLKELSPLPANSADYLKDGYKLIGIEHNKSIYVLQSQFTNNHHSFLKDHIELNPGGTASVQKELVKQYFNITNDVHELMLGINRFSNMGPAERRNWFTRLSETNYNYAISVYQKLKDKHRDLIGAIKLNQARLIQESNKLLDNNQQAQLAIEIDYIKSILNQLLQHKSNTAYKTDEYKSTLITLDSSILSKAKLLKQLVNKFSNIENFTSIQTIDQAIINHQANIAQSNLIINQLAKQINEQQANIQLLQKAKISDIKDIDLRILDVASQITHLTNQLVIPVTFTDPHLAYQTLINIKPSLLEILSNMPANTDHYYTKANYNEITNHIQTNEAQYNSINNLHQQKTIQLNKLLDDKTNHALQCPNCNHTWYQIYNELEYNRLVSELEQLEDRLANLSSVIAKFKLNLEDIKNYLTYYKAFIDIVNYWPTLNPLWDYIQTTKLLSNDPNKLVQLLDTLSLDLQSQINIHTKNIELSELNNLKHYTETHEQDNLAKLTQAIDLANEQIYHHKLNSNILINEVNNYKAYKDTHTKVLSLESELITLLTNRDKTHELLIDSIEKQAINELINIAQLELNKRETQLAKINMQTTLVNTLKEQINDYELKADIYAKLINELSPTDGLIARGLLGFIDHFIKQINSFIKKVWTYPLELISCKPEDNEVDLDYKFPLAINDSTTIPDINKASSAMKEVIDLAFKIVCMKYLKLANAPLFLDEFAANMDHTHRNAAFYVISQLMTQSDFSQIYIISHYEDLYGSLKNADVTVLCSNNINLPKNTVFNSHVVIK